MYDAARIQRRSCAWREGEASPAFRLLFPANLRRLAFGVLRQERFSWKETNGIRNHDGGCCSSGLQFTAIIFVITLVGALPLGVLVALGRMSKFKPLSLLVQFYISVMRGTPLMLQLMMWMFGPFYLFGASMGPDWKYFACCIGFILNYAAYFGEIYRSGIQSIPRGQYEAAEVLGYTRTQTFMKIILPQVFKRILPAMGNEVITLVKDTSLAFVLGIMEMFTQAKAIAAAQTSMMPYVIAGLIYWVFNFVVVMVLNRVEKRMNYYHD